MPKQSIKAHLEKKTANKRTNKESRRPLPHLDTGLDWLTYSEAQRKEYVVSLSLVLPKINPQITTVDGEKLYEQVNEFYKTKDPHKLATSVLETMGKIIRDKKVS